MDQEIERRIHAQADQLRAQARKQAETALELQLQDLRVELGERKKSSPKHGSRTSLRRELHKQCRAVKKAVSEDEPFEPFFDELTGNHAQ